MPTVAPPIVEEDEPSATGWIVAIVILALIAAGIGAGAIVYRSRMGPSEPDAGATTSSSTPEETSDETSDDDDEPPTDDYDVLRYDTIGRG